MNKCAFYIHRCSYISSAVKYSLKLIGFVVFSCNSLIQALVGKSRALSLFPFVVYCTCCGWAIHTKTVHGVCLSSGNTRFLFQCVCGAACMRYVVGSADDKTTIYIICEPFMCVNSIKFKI